MANSNTPSATMSTVPPAEELEEIQGFTYNALAVLGPNYFTRKWLPKKGPYFYAFVQCMRAHVFWDFETHEQKNKVFFEADTIAQMCGMSRATVFRLLNDPDMKLFVKRVSWRRWDKVQHKELQTANRYMVAMDDPPVDEADRAKVRKAQIQLEAMQRAETLIEDDDRPVRRGRSTPRNSSESQSETQIGVAFRDSDRCLTERHEDRILITDLESGDTSIGSKGVGRETIGRNQQPQRETQDAGRREHGSNETPIGASEADRNRIGSESAAARRSLVQTSDNGPTLTAAAVLSESEAWRVDAEDAAGFVIESILREFGDLAPAAGRAAILSTYQHYCPPVTVLVDLARLAKRRVNNRGGHIDSTAPGYYIRTMQNLAKEARREGWDVGKLIARWERKQTPAAQRTPARAASRVPTPYQSGPQRAAVRGRTPYDEDYHERLNASLYGR